MGRIDIVPDYSSSLAKSREPFAEEGAKTSEQVTDVAPTTVEAPTTKAVEMNTAEDGLVKKDTAKEEVSDAR